MSQEEPTKIPVITVVDLIKELSKYPPQTEVLLGGDASRNSHIGVIVKDKYINIARSEFGSISQKNPLL